MKNLLIPLDFSTHSIYALKAGAKIAKKYDYAITLVHMLELPRGFATNSFDNHAMRYKINLVKEKIKNTIDGHGLDQIKVNVVIKHFTVFQEIKNIAKEYNSSLIVMGSHGKEDEKISYLGSNTEEVVKNSKIPVLVIKEELQNIDFENPIFVSDFKIECADAYKRLKAFFDEIGVKPKLLFVNVPQNGFVSSEDMESRFKNFLIKAEGNLKNLNSFVNYDDYNVEDGAINFAKKHKSSIISVATHGISGFAGLFHKSISIGLTNKSRIPTLTSLI